MAESMSPYPLKTPTPERYPCTQIGCAEPSTRVEAAPFNRHGMSSSIAFYGYCDEHRCRSDHQ